MALKVLCVARRGGADCSSPVLTCEIQLATFGCGVPSGVGQSRQEAEDADIRALPGGLKQMQQIRVEREAEAMRTGHVPRSLAGLKGRQTCAERAGRLRRHRGSIVAEMAHAAVKMFASDRVGRLVYRRFGRSPRRAR
jgi:hypothetical protein